MLATDIWGQSGSVGPQALFCLYWTGKQHCVDGDYCARLLAMQVVPLHGDGN